MSRKQRTVSLSAVAVAAVVFVFAAAPIVADYMQAHAFFPGRFGIGGFHRFGIFGHRFFGGGFGPWWGGGCGCGCC